MSATTWIIWPVAIGLAAFLVDRLLLWMEARGWIYWRRSRRLQRGGSRSITALGGMFEPGPVYLAEVQEERTFEAEDAGDGNGRRRGAEPAAAPKVLRIPRPER